MGCPPGGNLSRAVVEGDDQAADGDVPPGPALAGALPAAPQELAPPPALGATRAVLMGFDPEVEDALAGAQVVAGDEQVLGSEELAQ
jgi:hypothetical protein